VHSPSPNSTGKRVVLVTAAARGLGLATARAFARQGDRVHVTWRSTNGAESSLAAEFGAACVHRADLAFEAEAQRLVGEVVDAEKRLDVLVHPVGDFATGALASARVDELAHMLESNVTTAFHVFDAARQALRAARGSALFFGVAGLDALRGRRETALYAAAKSALLVLMRSWALEEAPYGVRVNAVSPGVIPHAAADAMTLDPKVHARIPLGRAGTPEDVARAAVFLCSDDARYTTGVDLAVAGGWLA
jgi:NAD(P)-dependent dehydrogenase (short-subunit alcohol dehydrogenase family)